MSRKILTGFVLAAFIAATGCASGPRRLSRTWDDHVNQKYTEDAWIHGALLQDILPVYGIVGLLAGLGDLFVNAYVFWSDDAWDGKGTGFVHKNPSGTSKTVEGSGLN